VLLKAALEAAASAAAAAACCCCCRRSFRHDLHVQLLAILRQRQVPHVFPSLQAVQSMMSAGSTHQFRAGGIPCGTCRKCTPSALAVTASNECRQQYELWVQGLGCTRPSSKAHSGLIWDCSVHYSLHHNACNLLLDAACPVHAEHGSMSAVC